MTDGRGGDPSAGRDESQEEVREGAPGPKTGDEAGAPEPEAESAAEAGERAQPEPSPPPETPGGEKPAPRHRGRGALWAALGVALAVSVAAVTWPGWRPYLAEIVGGAGEQQRQVLADRLTALDARLADLDRTIEDLQDQVTQTTATAGRVGKLEDRLAGLSATLNDIAVRLGAVEKGLPAAGADERTAAALADIEERLARLESGQQRAARSDARSGALVLAVGQLRQAVDSGGAYADQLAALEAVAGGDAVVAEALSALEPQAQRGVPERAALRQRFDRVARDVVRAARTPEDGGWAARALARLATVVTVRRTGTDVEGESPEARVARAEARLRAGDLAAAVAEVEKLSGAAAAPAADWLAAARARLAADRALGRLYAHALERLVPAADTGR